MGVTVFFVISGFLLYRPFVAADMAGRGRTADTSLLPAPGPPHLPCVLVRAHVVALLPGVISVFTSDQWWRYYLLIQNYSDPHFVFQAGIGPAWSLSVEMAFYLDASVLALGDAQAAGSDPSWRLLGDLMRASPCRRIAALVRALTCLRRSIRQ